MVRTIFESGAVRACGAALLALALAWTAPGAARAGGRTAESAAIEESQVKAAFLFNFAKFVQWPTPPAGAMVIGVAGDRAFGELVDRMVHGRAINGRELVTRRLAYADDPAGCHVLFISGSQQRDVADMLLRTRGPVLTVGETVQFLRDGGMVRFYLENSRVRFQINQKNAEAAGLKVSSQLLTLAAR